MKRIASILFSMPATGVLLLIFAGTIGYATFIENSSGTVAAKILVYDAFWFKLMLLILMLNLGGSILVNRLVSKRKWTVSLFHFSFMIILAGGAVTRYSGTKGTIHIREGETSNHYLSEEIYVSIKVTDGRDTLEVAREVKFSENTRNRFMEQLRFKGDMVLVESVGFYESVSRTVTEDEHGGPVLSMVAMGSQSQSNEFILEPGEEKNFNDIVVSFEEPSDRTSLLVRESDGKLTVSGWRQPISAGAMGSEMTGLPLFEEFPLKEGILYQAGHIRFALKRYYPSGRTGIDFGNRSGGAETSNALRIKISSGDIAQTLDVFGTSDIPGQPSVVSVNDLKVSVAYGPVLRTLPFSIYLEDFRIDRYPGSSSPSSYSSEVTLLDKGEGVELPFRIFMNNILKYKGYRFFQSSYDPDEQGTILSVNHDWWGTLVTYLGYLFMTAGIIFTLFNHRSRFHLLIRASSKLKALRASSGALLLLVSIHSAGNGPATQGRIDPSHIRSFGELLVQGSDGRIEPVNTLASEILRKVCRQSKFEGFSPAEMFLEMNMDPRLWSGKKMIRIPSPEINDMLGITGDFISFDEIMSGGYRLRERVESAYARAPGARSKTDKEVLIMDERVNIVYLVLSGEFMRIFPVPGDPEHSWIFLGNKQKRLPRENNEFAIRTLSNYYTAVNSAKTSGQWQQAEGLLQELKNNQVMLGGEIVPSRMKIMLEVFYINFNPFGKLSKIFLFTGLILLVMVLMNIFRSGLRIGPWINVGYVGVAVLFNLQTAGLALRWYISGHAPWSNGYESMIFISWAACFSGLLFGRRSEMTLAVTTLLTGLTLLVAGMSWMNPELTNLVPVLKSYWLIIHVAIVTSSYGFLGIGALLGLMNLVLMILRNPQNGERVTLTIRELAIIIEISLMIGLYLITLGSFIGGVWANESWGRYWGWDPKETWALVTILVYAFIVHMHNIPGLRGHFQISTAALLGFGSVLMTYFGVNYYFSGLHSYASGEAAPVPTAVYIAVIIIMALVAVAYFSGRRTGIVSQAGDPMLEDLMQDYD